jgi:hypothetical protein
MSPGVAWEVFGLNAKDDTMSGGIQVRFANSASPKHQTAYRRQPTVFHEYALNTWKRHGICQTREIYFPLITAKNASAVTIADAGF